MSHLFHDFNNALVSIDEHSRDESASGKKLNCITWSLHLTVSRVWGKLRNLNS